MVILTKKEVIQQGKYPEYFIKDLLEPCPSIKANIHLTLRFNCDIHGEYRQTIATHLRGVGCPKCRPKIKHKPLEFVEQVYNDLAYDCDKKAYKEGKIIRSNNYDFICKIHGIYNQRFRAHLEGHGCPKCGAIRGGLNYREFVRESNPFSKQFLKDLEGSPDKDRVLSGELKTCDKAQFNCKKHGLYLQLIKDHLNKGTGCPICAQEEKVKKQIETKRAKNPFNEEFLKDLEGSPDKDRVLNLEVRGNDYVRFLCPQHGLYRQTLHSHLNGCGCPTCAAQKVNWVSDYEKRLLKDLGGDLVSSCRNIIFNSSGRAMELDLYSPSKKVAIEVNGIYWHSYEQMEESSAYNAPGGAKEYHLYKTELCEEQGIQLVHIWEDDLRDRYDVVLWMLKFKLGLVKRKRLMARKCIIQKVEPRERVAFYNKYHIQGDGQGICYGLYYQGHLISCMSVRRGPSNTSSKGAWELNRYASIHNYFVVGGFEKLFKFFSKTYDIHHWISYADRTVSDGSLYEHQGWKKTQVSNSDYKYVYKGIRYHKFNFRIKRFREDKSLKFKEGLSESQLAELNGITRIYDCGKIKYEKWV